MPTFAATKIAGVQVNDREETVTFVFNDPGAQELRLQIHRELALRMVSTLQSQFVAMETRARHRGIEPPASEGHTAEELLRTTYAIEAHATTTLHPQAVRLCIDPGQRDELNYGLDPDLAEQLARELDRAAKEAGRAASGS